MTYANSMGLPLCSAWARRGAVEGEGVEAPGLFEVRALIGAGLRVEVEETARALARLASAGRGHGADLWGAL